jgi:DNA polymerase III sliding clamp (beta) subunit (PCNA family)
MTTVVFETATLADSLKKAALVAPTKGAAFDKAAGIVLSIDPTSSHPVTLRSTNTEIFYTEVVDTISASGPAVMWRLPTLISTIISSLPIGSGKEVSLEQDGGAIKIKQNRATAKIGLISTDYYPQWEPFDPAELQEVESLGERIKQVQWAAATGANTEPLSGIHFDGERIICTDRYRIAIADCKIGHVIDSAVTVPAGILGSVVKQMGDTLVGTDGEMMLLMPNDHTQIRATLYGSEFPNVDRIIARKMPESVTLKKESLLDIIRRATSVVGSERFPTLRLYFGNEEIAAFLATGLDQSMGDVTSVAGQCQHKRVEIKFTPKMLMDAIEVCPNDDVTLSYTTDPKGGMLVVDGGSGYRAWVAPRRADTDAQG